jgi:hypothetical protein
MQFDVDFTAASALVQTTLKVCKAETEVGSNIEQIKLSLLGLPISPQAAKQILSRLRTMLDAFEITVFESLTVLSLVSDYDSERGRNPGTKCATFSRQESIQPFSASSRVAIYRSDSNNNNATC